METGIRTAAKTMRKLGLFAVFALLFAPAVIAVPVSADPDNTDEAQQNLLQTLDNIRNLLLAIGGVAASIGIIAVGYKWMASAGNPEERLRARAYLMDVVIGIIIIFASGVIVSVVRGCVVG